MSAYMVDNNHVAYLLHAAGEMERGTLSWYRAGVDAQGTARFAMSHLGPDRRAHLVWCERRQDERKTREIAVIATYPATREGWDALEAHARSINMAARCSPEWNRKNGTNYP